MSMGICSFSEQVPQISIHQIEKRIYVQKLFQIMITLQNIKKETEPYCFFPPEYENKNENLFLEVKNIKSNESADKVNLEICMEGVAKETGTYEIGSIKVPYVLLSGELESEFVKDNTRALPTSYWDIPPIYIEVKKDNTMYTLIFVGGIIVLVIFVGIGLFVYKGKRGEQVVQLEITDAEVLHTARKFRLDGDYYEYFRTLLHIVQRLNEKEKKTELEMLINKINEKMNDVGYRGFKPSETELEWFWKEVENCIDRYKKQES
ncbi:MAG TPA: hypothetical protein PLT82_02375 [Candidatus Hydrogenedens sp.]|nr:hypothetical protein [Candidatus Hydrogenedens sp.]HPP57957.1 hypothetical protein [Candidatus Hydrogenedens sp.]